MINMKKTVLTSAVAVALGMGGMTTAQAAVVAVDVMTVTGGQFALGFFTPTGPIPFSAVSGPGVDIAGQYNSSTWDVNTAQTSAAAGSIASFNFGSAFVNTFTAAGSSQTGVGGGGPVPSGTFDNAGGTTTFNTSSFFANWNGTDFNQGNAAASLVTTNCSATGCDYTLSWQSLIVGGAFNGNTGTWLLRGTVAAAPVSEVPLPAAVWLLGSGLVGLVGVARRRKTQA